MRIYTVHVKAGAPPVVLREGFSLGAFFFGPFWLAAKGAFTAAGLLLAMWILLAALVPVGLALIWPVLLVVQGIVGRDLVRWNLERRGHVLAHVVAGRDELAAWGRLLGARPDLAGRMGPRATL